MTAWRLARTLDDERSDVILQGGRSTNTCIFERARDFGNDEYALVPL
jgi:hypothetical protein